MRKIAFFSTYNKDVLDLYLQYCPSEFDVSFASPTSSLDEMIHIAERAEAIILHAMSLPNEVYEVAKNTKLIQLLSAGYDNVNFELSRKMNFPIANIGGTNAPGVAEIVLLLILGVYRRIVHMDNAVRNGKWLKDVITGYPIMELAGKTVGIVGLGNIGRTLAKRLQGFDVTMIGYDLLPPTESEKSLNIKRVSKNDLFKESDIISLHIPLLQQTKHFVGVHELSLMNENSILINTSRGPVVDEKALISVLQKNKIAGAGLDVFEEEPINRDNPLLSLDNVVLTPHAAGSTKESWPRRAIFAFENIKRVFNQKEALSLIKNE